jgi:hypothetical protein
MYPGVMQDSSAHLPDAARFFISAFLGACRFEEE